MYYKKLAIWERSFLNTKSLYDNLSNITDRKYWALLDQMRRSSLSIPSNIAEGSVRYSDKEFRRFLAIALGSAVELQTQLELLKELSPNMKIDSIIKENEEISKMIVVFRSKIKV